MARAVPMGTVHGSVVDELDGQPLPWFRFRMNGEDLVTDAHGVFQGAELHSGGRLQFYGEGWHHELAHWDPAR